MNGRRLAAAVVVALIAAAVAILLWRRGDRVDETGTRETSAADEKAPKPAELAAGGGREGASGDTKTTASTASSSGQTTGIASPRWRLRLTVASSVTHQPLAGATATLALARGVQRTPLGTHQADAEGLIDIALPALDAMSDEARSGARIVVEQAYAAGHRMIGLRGAIAEDALRGRPTTL